MNLSDAEAILRQHPNFGPGALHDEKYELTFETPDGRQIALNRKSSRTAVRIWIEASIDPHAIGLSEAATIAAYPRDKRRAHLSASRLTGPYHKRAGNAAWYVSVTSESDFRRLLDAYLG